MENNFIIVFVTTPNAEVAQKIARKLVHSKMAAGVNILPGMTSIYTWKGEICEAGEVLMMIKTQTALFDILSTTIKAEHPYEIPEIIAVSISTGSASYLSWINEVTQRV